MPVGGRQVPCSLALAAALCACGSSRAPDQSVAPDGGAIYGLDARPSNTTCLAPSRPPAAIDLWRALGGRSFSWPVLVLQAPADASRFFVVQKGGIVSAVSPDGADASDFIDITSKTNSSYDESGLLGDFRFGTPPSQGYCGTAPVVSEMGVPGALLVAPGHPEKSLVLLRMKALDQYRMPPLASHVVDQASVDVLTSWIGGLSPCP